MSQELKSIKIGISGLGLIGGSIYKCFVKNGIENIYAYSGNIDTINKIQEMGYQASQNIEILSNCDVIFVCSPISKTVKTIKDIFKINQNAIFIDVASLKKEIVEEIQNVGCKFIGSHPMAGTENSGFDASFAELFNGAIWVLMEQNTLNSDEITLIKELIALTGAKIIETDAISHDLAVANISHLPMLISQSLISTNIEHNLSLKLAASGFRDTTRLAMSNSVMAKDMLSLNKENIKTALQNLINEAEKLLNNEKYFDEKINKIISLRKSLYDENGKNIY